MDEKLKLDVQELTDAGKKIAEIKAEISKAEKKIYDLNEVAKKKGQFASVVSQAKENIAALQKTIEQMEAEIEELKKSL